MLERMHGLTNMLNEASYEYYNTGYPVMDDAEFDHYLDELQRLEIKTGVVLPNSPTINAGSRVATEQKKITHEHPMLSLAKIHSIEEIQDFLKDKHGLASVKLDGMTVSATYINGKLTRLETRGNGEIGTDIMIHKNSIAGLPQTINHNGKYVIDDECIITYDNFYNINDSLGEDEKFKNPRNMVSGSLNLLDSNISGKRGLAFIVWNVIEDTETYTNSMLYNFLLAKQLGFTVVLHREIEPSYNSLDIDMLLETIKSQADFFGYPMDGVVFSYDDINYGKSLGKTEHHFNHSIAYKFEDAMYKTKLLNIEWNTSKSGLVNPVAVFEPVDLDGAVTTRATLHNISYIEDLQLGIGDTIQVYRANMVIPKVGNNLTRSNTWEIPDKCPCCGGDVEIHNVNGSKTLHCSNQGCHAKLLGKLVHFCSKNALDIENMSEATLQFLIEKGWVNSFKDIYRLNLYQNEWITCDGFGEKSVHKLLENIEKSRNTTVERCIYGLSIPLIGRSASKDISKACNGDVSEFINIMTTNAYPFLQIDGFGEEMYKSIVSWWNNNKFAFLDLSNEFNFEKTVAKNNDISLEKKVFVITGSLQHHKNREELVNIIEGLGGKVSGSVSSKTDYLINNDTESNSSKNRKAKELGVNIISEEQFISMIQ